MDIITNTCKIDDCIKVRAPGRKGWCLMHYTRWINHGDTSISKIDRSILNATKLIEYKSWQAMKERCLKKTHKNYPKYGGAGIIIYEPWIKSFKEFYEHIGKRPSVEYTLDRIVNTRGYYPGNVKWSTHKEQSSNRRSNVFYTINDETKTLKQWCELKGLNYKTVWQRINGYGKSFEDSLY